MAMTADSSSPRDGLNSPQYRRKTLPSPWAQVVRGESESISAVHHPPPSPSSTNSAPVASLPEQTTFSVCSPSKAASSSSSSPGPPDISLAADGSTGSNGNNNAAARSKKPAWNKPSNGAADVGPVMGAASWPALSESARASPKSLPDSSSKTVPDGSLSTSQGPVIPQSTQKQGTSNANSNSTPHHTMSGRQRSSKRGGSGGGRGNNSASGPPQSGFSHQHPTPPPPPPPPFPVIQMPPNSYGNFVPAMPDPSMRDHQFRGNNWETRPSGGFPSQSHNDHRHSSRRGGNYGPRGDGGYHNNLGGRRDQDRGNYGNTRDGHMQPQRAPPRGFPRHPPPSAHTFIPAQPVRPFVNSFGYPDLIYYSPMPMEPFRGMPLFTPAPPPAMMMPAPEVSLSTLILNQIDYYFSDNNLVKDEYLKSNMDDQGWVAISLIAGFPRVKNLTSNIQLILDSLRSSTVVEVQDDRVRRRNEWMKWIPSRVNTELGLPSRGGSSSDMLASSFQQITLEEETTNRSEASKVNPHTEDTSERRPSELIGSSLHSKGEGFENTCLDQN